MKYFLITFSFSVSLYSLSFNHDLLNPNYKPTKTNTLKAGCAPASKRLTLQYNDVSALLETGGIMFLDRANGIGAYEVPKGSGITAIYAGSLWMGGEDVNGQLKLAAQRFRSSGNDFWTGPLSAGVSSGNYNPLQPVGDNSIRPYGDANISSDQCVAYDEFFTIRKSEVVRYISWWECNNIPANGGCGPDIKEPTNDELNRINNWPAHGDVSLNQDKYLAPFYDYDKDGEYNPQKGDYPWYDDILDRNDIVCGSDRRVSLFGDETHWWVFNDKGSIHSESGGDPIGMEIRAQAFVFSTNDEVNRMTFYNYEMINRGTQTLKNTYFSQYVDADLGNYSDDYVGCDVTRGLGYCYNGDANDEPSAGKIGYGINPPAIGIDFFEGPYQDADNLDNPGPVVVNGKLVLPTVLDAIAKKGIVYAGLGIGYGDGIKDNERFGMKRFSYYTNGSSSSVGDPTTAAGYYNYMKGKWNKGDQTVYGGTGFPGSPGSTTINSDYMFPGDSDTLNWGTAGISPGNNNWSELLTGSVSNKPGDRRFVQSAGPFTLKPGAVNNITVGIIYARSSEGDNSLRALKRADTKAQLLFDNCFKILEPPCAPRLTVKELDKKIILTIDNPSSSNNKNEKYTEEDKANIIDPGNGVVYDKFYHFEGYQIYQVKSKDASISDIGDVNKSRLVVQCDVKNNVSKLINFEFDEELGFSLPVEKVKGENKGIKHSFLLNEDQFASGVKTFVNFKTYYFIAVSYAYNNFKQYNPNDASYLDGQKTPYISSRVSFDGSPIVASAAMPHNRITSNIVSRSVYGSSPKITRIDGKGNGNRALSLTSESEDSVVKNGFFKSPTYNSGNGPIEIKVIDPLNLVDGYFECKFTNYVPETANEAKNNKGVDTASWIIYRYDKMGGVLLDSVKSDASIKVDNEQLIPSWGVSVQIAQSDYYFTDIDKSSYTISDEYKRFTEPISSSISFSDSSKKWLSFINDEDDYSPNNWIRSGTYSPKPAEDEPTSGIRNPSLYPDEVMYLDATGQPVFRDPFKKYTKLLSGGIAPHSLVGYQGSFMPLAYPKSYFTPTNARDLASISRLNSISIIITSDTSKWTRCPVFELGRIEALNEGNAPMGTLRRGKSIDKLGNVIPGSTGLSWFPGYAIDLETGQRLHMGFGENSFLGSDNGKDMKWNPSSVLYDASGNPHMGGQQPIYVFGVNVNGYDVSKNANCPYYDGKNNWIYDKMKEETQLSYLYVYHSLLWIANTITVDKSEFLSTNVRISVNVNKQYNDFVSSNINKGKPMYSWSMDNITSKTASLDQRKDALSIINVVPNPYYAFSSYERNRLDTRVKIINLPDKCTVKIYNVGGKLIRTFIKDTPLNYIDWDLKNHQSIPISSGVYLIHIEVPGVGETILKFFGGIRQFDLENI